MSVTQSSVVELRQYVLKPGATQTLVDVFEAEFVESQEVLGMAVGAVATGDEWVVVTVWLHEPGHGTCSWLAETVQPLLAEALGTTVATWRTEPAENTFPVLPVRPDHAFVWTATFADHASYAAALTALERHPAWPRTMSDLDSRGVLAETLRLRPTARSSHPPAG